ncbi:MAG: hypothetical protein ACM31L_12885 [Actinomycetota bacterium]
MKTVAAISFRDNHSLSMDVEGVSGIDMGVPMRMDDGTWFCEMLIRTDHGVVAVQLVADSPEKLTVNHDFPT